MRTVHMARIPSWSPPRSRSARATPPTQIAAGIDTAERRVRAAVPIAKTIYLEPDIYRPAEADESDPAIRAVQRSQPPVPPPPAAAAP